MTEDVASACCPRLAAPSPRSTLSQKSISSNFIFIRHLTPKRIPHTHPSSHPIPPFGTPAPFAHLQIPSILSRLSLYPQGHSIHLISLPTHLLTLSFLTTNFVFIQIPSTALAPLPSSSFTHPTSSLLFTRAHPSAFRTLRALRVLRISYFIPIFKLGNDSPSINLLSGFIIYSRHTLHISNQIK